jgi:hypothetical protein
MNEQEKERAIRIVLWGRKGSESEAQGDPSREVIDFLRSLAGKSSEKRQSDELDR